MKFLLRSRWRAASFALVSFSLALAGCAGTHTVKVDALARPKADATSYTIRNVTPGARDNPLRADEAAELVKTALSAHGLYAAPAGVAPSLIVDVDYGVGPAKMERTMVRDPNFGRSPDQAGSILEDRSLAAGDAPATPRIRMPGDARERPSEATVVTTAYEKHIRITARENPPSVPGQPPREIWLIDVTSEGPSKDLRAQLPVLVAAGMDQVGKSSQGQVTLKIADSDPRVVFEEGW